MTSEGITIRRGTPADSRACFDVFLPALADLTVRLGVRWGPEPEALWARQSSLYELLAGHAAEWWVAEDPSDGGLVGYARSVERGGLFELAEFFVHPERQSAGVGRRLLELAFPPDRGEVRVIIATTDVRAQARYYAAGTAARFPIASLEGAPRADAPVDPDLEVVPATPDHRAVLERLEAALLDHHRGAEFEWLLIQRHGYVYRRDGAEIGYAFGGEGGHGPVGALEVGDLPPILGHLEATAAAAGRERISFEVPMVNETAIRHLLGRGFRIDPFYAFLMSSRPFGRFDRYIGFSPPFVL